jgi:hypothetical protein
LAGSNPSGVSAKRRSDKIASTFEERARRFLKSYFVRRAAPILKRFVVEGDDVVRKVIAHFGWKASVVRESRRPTKNPRC